ncbi:MAG: hypothetical protein AABX03_04380 [Nanoarchaeota archaeon]
MKVEIINKEREVDASRPKELTSSWVQRISDSQGNRRCLKQ